MAKVLFNVTVIEYWTWCALPSFPSSVNLQPSTYMPSTLLLFPPVSHLLLMATSSIALALADAINIYHGFWYSHGSSLPKGPMLTLSTFWFTFISSCITLYLAWALSRIWCISSALMFHSVFKKTKHSLQESQCATLIVNSKSPLDVLFDCVNLIRRGGPKGTLKTIFGTSIVILCMNAVIPALLATFPAYNGGIIASSTCGLFQTLAVGTVNASNFWEAAGHITASTMQ